MTEVVPVQSALTASEEAAMFWAAIGDVLTVAIAIAINPVAIVTAILLVLSPRGNAKSVVFAMGWAIPIFVTVALGYVFVGVATEAADADVAQGVDLLHLVLGLMFLALAYVAWRSRTKPGEEPHQPKVFGRVESMSVIGAFGLGLVEVLLAVQMYPLAIGASARMHLAGLEGAEAVAAMAVFTVLASIAVIAPVIVALVGERLRRPFEEFKRWLVIHTKSIMIVVFLILGLDFIGQGLRLLG